MKNKKIKILFVIDTLGAGGKERQLSEIIRNLDEDKYKISLIVKESGGSFYDIIIHKIHKLLIVGRTSYKFSDIFLYKKFIEDVNPDVAFTFFNRMSHVVALSKFFSRKKYVLINGSIRDAIIDPSRRLKTERFLYKFYKYVVANSNAGLKAYHQDKKKNRFVLYNGFDLKRIPSISKENIRKNLGYDNDDIIITMVGSLSPKKDQMSLVAATRNLSEKYKIKLILVGEGIYYETYKKYFETNSLNYINLTDRREDVEAVLKMSDISVLMTAPHWGEGIPNVVLESFALGLPVIASDNGGTKEILENDFNGFLIKAKDVKALEEKLLLIIKDEKIRQKFSVNAKKTVNEKFSIASMIRNFETIIHACLNNSIKK